MVRHGVEAVAFDQRDRSEGTEIPGRRCAILQKGGADLRLFTASRRSGSDLRGEARVAEAIRGSVVMSASNNNANAKASRGLRACPRPIPRRKPYSSLPGYAKAFESALLPFVKNELPRTPNPLKLRDISPPA